MRHGMSCSNVQDEIGSDLQRARWLCLRLWALGLWGSGGSEGEPQANLGRTNDWARGNCRAVDVGELKGRPARAPLPIRRSRRPRTKLNPRGPIGEFLLPFFPSSSSLLCPSLCCLFILLITYYITYYILHAYMCNPIIICSTYYAPLRRRVLLTADYSVLVLPPPPPPPTFIVPLDA